MDTHNTPVVLPKIIDKSMLPGPSPMQKQGRVAPGPKYAPEPHYREDEKAHNTDAADNIAIDVDENQNDETDKPSLGSTIFTFVNKNKTTILIIIFALLIAIFVLYLFYFRKESEAETGPVNGRGPPENFRHPPARMVARMPDGRIVQPQQLQQPAQPQQGNIKWTPSNRPQTPAPERPIEKHQPAPDVDHHQLVNNMKEDEVHSLLNEMKEINFSDTEPVKNTEAAPKQEDEPEPESEPEIRPPQAQSGPEQPAQNITEWATDEEPNQTPTAPQQIRCQAITKNKGEVCGRWATKGSNLCFFHGKRPART